MFWGKLIGFWFGWMFAGPFGGALGLWLGHQWDKGLRINLQGTWQSAEGLRQTQKAFFEQTFKVMGHVAKADGRVTQDAIRMAKHVMSSMQLGAAQQEQASEFFRQGKAPDFDLSAALAQLQHHCHRHRGLLQTFVEIQFQAARADGGMSPNQKAILKQICHTLGFSPLFSWDFADMFEQYSNSGAHHHRQQTAHANSSGSLEEAYRILGVSENDSMHLIKKAYRRLMNQHHPDKLIAKGLPEEMIKLANDKTQRIKRAYELIKRHRE